MSSRLLCAICCVGALWIVSRASAEDASAEYWVDPLRGQDVAGAGSSAAPFRTIGHALSTADDGEIERLRLRLASGHYRGGPDQAIRMPFDVPESVRSLEVVGATAEAGPETVLRCDDDSVAIWSVLVDRSPTRNTLLEALSFRSVRFVGGLYSVGMAGAVSDARDGAELALVASFRDCVFEGTAGAALTMGTAFGAAVSVSVTECRFEGCHGGIAFELLQGGMGDLQVSHSKFVDFPRTLPGEYVDSAVDVHFDDDTTCTMDLRYNEIRNTVAGVTITSDYDTDGTIFSGRIVSNLLYSEAGEGCIDPGAPEDAEPCALDVGLVVSVVPAAGIDLIVANNTFVSLGEYAVFYDNAEYLSALPIVEWGLVDNNVFWNVEGAGEDAELSNLPVLPLDGLRFERNLVPPAWLEVPGGVGLADHLTVDPNFYGDRPRRLRFQPEIGNSPAIDAGIPLPVEVLGNRDLGGYCRVAGGVVDLGAYESDEGLCGTGLVEFVRGDCARDELLEISDAIAIITILFLASDTPAACLDACDTNDTGVLDLTDAVFLLGFLFMGQAPPAPPFPQPGVDESPDRLGPCAVFDAL